MDDPTLLGVVPGPESGVAHTEKSNDDPQESHIAAGPSTNPSENGDTRSKNESAVTSPKATEETTLSKNQLKKQKRQQDWEDKKEDRKRRRKEKRHDRQERRRAERDALITEAEAEGRDPEEARKSFQPRRRKSQLVPLSFIVDCDFEQYMTEHELVSLSTQITRCYSTNKSAEYRGQLYLSSWSGALRTRFATVYSNNHLRWHDTHFVEGDFVDAAKAAQKLMEKSSRDGLPDTLSNLADAEEEGVRNLTDPSPGQETEESTAKPSLVYLTSDSPYTLDRLEPYTSYVIGGLVDRNREKGICYKRAEARGIRTAKLPIGEYMTMASRFVLTTNQVVEIMSKWLECGDWGAAFAAIIPQRKGGKLKGSTNGAVDGEGGGEDEENIPVAVESGSTQRHEAVVDTDLDADETEAVAVDLST